MSAGCRPAQQQWRPIGAHTSSTPLLGGVSPPPDSVSLPFPSAPRPDGIPAAAVAVVSPPPDRSAPPSSIAPPSYRTPPATDSARRAAAQREGAPSATPSLRRAPSRRARDQGPAAVSPCARAAAA